MVNDANAINRYPFYKYSGVEWLGEIPSNWEVLPGLSFIFENKDRNKGMVRKTILSLSYGNIRIKGDEELTGLVPESFETYQFVNIGDLIFRPTDLQNDTLSLRSSISEHDGIITNAYLNLRFKSKANSKFFHYFFRAIDNNKLIYGLGSGLRQNISFLDFRRFLFPFPPLSEQTAIATFLDRKTALIDQAIDIKQKQIELLKERRQILIHKAVTRGLNPNVKMKDSGVEWIGVIPEGWEVKPLKHLGYVYPGITGKRGEDFSKEYSEGMKPFIPFTNIFRYDVISNEEFQYVKIRDTEKQNKVYRNDLLFLMSSETLEDIGKCSIYLGDEKQLYLNSFCKGFRITSPNIEPTFVNALLLSNIYRSYFSVVGRGFTRMNIKQEYVNLLPILIPKIDEQNKIIGYVNMVNSKIKSAIIFKEQEIEKLKEYKATLINSAVTGKIKVS